jgi:uncharacterized membrane protein
MHSVRGQAATTGGLLAALVASTVVALTLLAGRAWWFSAAHLYLPWNLALAWVPWALGVVVSTRRTRLGLLLWLLPWVLFLPNAPYVVTDFVHLRERPPAPLWLDVMVFASFAWSGCWLGWTSLAMVHVALRRAWGSAVAHVSLVLVLGATGCGVYLGRFGRWNSWDVVTRPSALGHEMVATLGEPSAVLFVVVFAAFVGAGFLLVASLAAPLRGVDPT